MYASNNAIKIAILEDSQFYNDLLSRHIEDFSKALAELYNVDIEVSSYLRSEDLLLALRADTNILFTDYYLGKNTTANIVIDKVKEYCPKCKIVIMSQNRNSHTVTDTLNKGADKFIYKDKQSLERSCFYIEDFIKNDWKI